VQLTRVNKVADGVKV